ncbi:tRNA-adenosine deaminase [Desulfonispora thiosulfatigenes DSM 11270]|uniref:tRNA-specific adenosine deaminase n=1 Tax=Desulfonispora thiosulfatigenes DSM 11270 TaxID=656914 RepID=A0A1W1V275_DESTI|nr:tRNA adenosine(34) deaminase TadA [Desulfonispora thiosulfatigenes]SMB87400.1 tRNA-adenosine deaminase [Desulfonispora thiosulfatigenes DSM 11270]
MNHEYFMNEALIEAKKALAKNEVPIGAVIVREGEIIGRGHNLCETNNDATAHAEIMALRNAGQGLGTWRLNGALIYVTIEPCPMCAGALINSRIETVVYGADEPKFGSAGSQINLLQFPGFNHQVRIIAGIQKEECENLIKGFFKTLRERKKK